MKNSGFTLMEMTIVVGIMAMLAGIVILAINPARHFAAARNSQRQADLEKIQGALNELAIETNGALPASVSSTLQMLGTPTSSCNVTCGAVVTASSCINLAATLVPTYIPSIPYDPTVGNASQTYYAMQKISRGPAGAYGFLLRACTPELNAKIEVSQ